MQWNTVGGLPRSKVKNGILQEQWAFLAPSWVTAEPNRNQEWVPVRLAVMWWGMNFHIKFNAFSFRRLSQAMQSELFNMHKAGTKTLQKAAKQLGAWVLGTGFISVSFEFQKQDCMTAEDCKEVRIIWIKWGLAFEVFTLHPKASSSVNHEMQLHPQGVTSCIYHTNWFIMAWWGWRAV